MCYAYKSKIKRNDLSRKKMVTTSNKNYINIFDSVITEKDCKDLIKKYKKISKKEKIKFLNYSYVDIDINQFPHNKKIFECIEKYKEDHPEINLTHSYWGLTNLRFKFWKKGECFNDFHSEHCFTFPNRILSFQIYLTNHNCGTEFYDKNVIKSKAGRFCLFPAYFTHTHKGQADLKKDRCIITGYFEFVKPGEKEL